MQTGPAGDARRACRLAEDRGRLVRGAARPALCARVSPGRPGAEKSGANHALAEFDAFVFALASISLRRLLITLSLRSSFFMSALEAI